MGHQFAGVIPQAEIFLVMAHYRDQDLLRQFEEAFSEGAGDGLGDFDQVGDGFQEFGVVDYPAAETGFDGRQLLFDRFPARGRVDHHAGLKAKFDVVGRGGDRELAGGHEAVAAGNGAALYPGPFEGNDLVAVECYNPVDRPGEAGLEVMPAHRFAERDRADEGGQRLNQQSDAFFPFFPLAGTDILPFFGGHDFQLFGGYALAPGKAQAGLGGLAVFIEGDASGRAQVFDHPVFLALGQAVNQQGQPARGAEHPDFTMFQPQAVEHLLRQGLQVNIGLAQETGRDLLGADLQ